jgi:hypothetical protein
MAGKRPSTDLKMRGTAVADRKNAAPIRKGRGRPVVALMLLAGALIAASQIDAFAQFTLVIWLASFAAVCVALLLAVREWRATRK